MRNAMIQQCLKVLIIISMFPIPKSQADVLGLPKPGQRISLSATYHPPIMKGLTVHKDNPFRFDFIVDPGESSNIKLESSKDEYLKLVKYFLAALAIKESDLWVNLSPYEKNRIVADTLSQTDMGRDMLASDYLLKQMAASLIYPETDLGERFWKEIYGAVSERYSKEPDLLKTLTVNMGTFNKVWIVAAKAEVFERNQSAYVTDSYLKVMLEQDYLAIRKNSADAKFQFNEQGVNKTTNEIIKNIVLPQLEREINYGKNFSALRQIYNAIILAAWYKKNLQRALLNHVYSNQNNITGINLEEKGIKEQIYAQYVKAYKKGVFNYIKETDLMDGADSKEKPRKYFAGGIVADMAMLNIKRDVATGALAIKHALPKDRSLIAIESEMTINVDRAQNSSDVTKQSNEYVHWPYGRRAMDLHKFGDLMPILEMNDQEIIIAGDYRMEVKKNGGGIENVWWQFEEQISINKDAQGNLSVQYKDFKWVIPMGKKEVIEIDAHYFHEVDHAPLRLEIESLKEGYSIRREVTGKYFKNGRISVGLPLFMGNLPEGVIDAAHPSSFTFYAERIQNFGYDDELYYVPPPKITIHPVTLRRRTNGELWSDSSSVIIKGNTAWIFRSSSDSVDWYISDKDESKTSYKGRVRANDKHVDKLQKHYDLLGIPLEDRKSITIAVVEDAFRRKMRQIHPDANPDKPELWEESKKLVPELIAARDALVKKLTDDAMLSSVHFFFNEHSKLNENMHLMKERVQWADVILFEDYPGFEGIYNRVSQATMTPEEAIVAIQKIADDNNVTLLFPDLQKKFLQSIDGLRKTILTERYLPNAIQAREIALTASHNFIAELLNADARSSLREYRRYIQNYAAFYHERESDIVKRIKEIKARTPQANILVLLGAIHTPTYISLKKSSWSQITREFIGFKPLYSKPEALMRGVSFARFGFYNDMQPMEDSKIIPAMIASLLAMGQDGRSTEEVNKAARGITSLEQLQDLATYMRDHPPAQDLLDNHGAWPEEIVEQQIVSNVLNWLNIQAIAQVLTQKDFLEKDLNKMDIDDIVILGNDDLETFRQALRLFAQGIGKRIYIAGGHGRLTLPLNRAAAKLGINVLVDQTEAETIRQIMIYMMQNEEEFKSLQAKLDVAQAIVTERKVKLPRLNSRNTLENFIFYRDFLIEEGSLNKKDFKALYIQVPHQQWRAQGTFNQIFEKEIGEHKMQGVSFTRHYQEKVKLIDDVVRELIGEMWRLIFYTLKGDLILTNKAYPLGMKSMPAGFWGRGIALFKQLSVSSQKKLAQELMQLQQEAGLKLEEILPQLSNEQRVFITQISDTAMTSGPGGIDLIGTQAVTHVRQQGNGVVMDIDPIMLDRIKREGITSLTPKIIKIKPLADIWVLFGLHDLNKIV